ncbi:MAG TPA: STAS domain-containing protein [Syntrophales bacterium]|nr:STAS domain-containing protein [Syntrophales bacterium]
MTPAKTAITQLGNHTIVTLKEPITYQNCKELEDCIERVAGKSQAAIILECKAVSYVDSVALEMLLRLQEKIMERGMQLKIVSLNAVCRDIMIVTRLINQFTVHASVPEAIKEPL